jgi:hypothetical protein
MNDLETKAVEILKRHPEGMRAGDLGWHLWGETTEAPARGIGSHGQNKFCRSAGKLLKRLRQDRKAYPTYTKHNTLWRAVGE